MLSGINQRYVAIAGLAACGLSFVGYCIYFDRKRRSDPMFREKLKQKRLEAKRKKESSILVDCNPPDMTDLNEIQEFIYYHIQSGEIAYKKGDTDVAAEHFAVAVSCTPRPETLIHLLATSADEETMNKVLQRLPVVKSCLLSMNSDKVFASTGAQKPPSRPFITVDDLE